MLCTLSLYDFQAHEKTVLHMKGGFICIVGPSNVGKSSVVRAVRWVLYDSMRGNRFIRQEATTAHVKIEFDDTIIERVKSKKENRYGVSNDPMGNGHNWYDAIGTGTPQEVTRALQIPQMKVDKDTEIELNVSMQLDPPFLVFATDSLRAKFLNVLTGGHVLDAAVRETNRKVKEIDDKYKIANNQLDQIQEDLKQYSDLEYREQALHVLSEHVNQFNTHTTNLQALEESKRKLTELSHAKSHLQKQQGAVAHITDESINTLEQWLNWLTFLENSKRQLTYLRGSRVKLEAQYATVASVRDEDLNKLVTLIAEIDSLQNSKNTLANLKDRREQWVRNLAIVDRQITTATAEYMAMADSVCDACGQPVTNAVRKKQLEAINV